MDTGKIFRSSKEGGAIVSIISSSNGIAMMNITIRDAVPYQVCSFLTLFKRGGGFNGFTDNVK